MTAAAGLPLTPEQAAQRVIALADGVQPAYPGPLSAPTLYREAARQALADAALCAVATDAEARGAVFSLLSRKHDLAWQTWRQYTTLLRFRSMPPLEDTPQIVAALGAVCRTALGASKSDGQA